MGRLSKRTITLPPHVTLREEEGALIFVGPKGEKKLLLLPSIAIAREGDSLKVHVRGNTRQAHLNHGTMWSLIQNALLGVTHGFSKTLEISGIGYRASMEGNIIVLFLGYAHPIRYEAPAGIAITVEKNFIKISGVDRELVGRVAADIRALKKPEPYKGKGIRYEGEVIKRKVGKKAAVSGGSASAG